MALTIVLAVIVAFTVPAGMRPQTASAQAFLLCPDGSVVYAGQACSGSNTTGYQYCNGTYVPSGQYCPPTTNGYPSGQYCNGTYIPSGQYCPATTGYYPGSQYCNGTYIPSGQYCPPTTGSYPGEYCNGTYIPNGQYCPPSRTSYYPGSQYCNGTYISNGQYCPSTTHYYPGSQYCNGTYIPSGQYCPSTTGSYPSSGGLTVTYSAGWNIVAGPTGTTLTGTFGPLYTMQNGSNAYQTLPAGTPLQAGAGYWAYFNAPTTMSLALASYGTVSVPLPPGQYVLIGNPGSTSATVTGASSVLTYTPGASGYTQASQLAPGQGAWAVSLAGGTATIAPAP